MRFAATSLNITPSKPVHMGASGKFTGLSTGIDSELEANVLCLADETFRTAVVLVSLDLLYPGRPITDAVRRGLSHRKNVNAFVVASHTHRAPMTDPDKPGLGQYNSSYVKSVVARLEPAIDACLGRLQVVDSVRIGSDLADSSINRRLRKRVVVARRLRVNAFVNAPNPAGAKDEVVTVLEVHGTAGVECVLWNYACHPVGYPRSNRISAHFPGLVRDQIRADMGAQLPVLFLQGFSGNVRPAGTARVHSARRKMRQLISGRLFEDFDNSNYSAWCHTLSTVVGAARRNSKELPLDTISVRVAKRPANTFVEDAPGEMEVARISLGDSVELFLATGELMVEQGLKLRRHFQNAYVLPVGCVGETIGYLPTATIQKEGGYEGGAFTTQFGIGPMKIDAPQALDELFTSVME